jgi:hypothetical protein
MAVRYHFVYLGHEGREKLGGEPVYHRSGLNTHGLSSFPEKTLSSARKKKASFSLQKKGPFRFLHPYLSGMFLLELAQHPACMIGNPHVWIRCRASSGQSLRLSG